VKQVLIDTNAYSYLLRGDAVVEREIAAATEVLVSVITLGELYLGFNEGKQLKGNLEDLGNFLKKPSVKVVDIDAGVAVTYGQVKYALRKKGTPISENDVWIAAQAIEVKAELITYDRHFLVVPRLKLWKELKN